ncbi:MAG: hypothetical protein WCG51_06695, partial [Elusimicrobiota bacterium]
MPPIVFPLIGASWLIILFLNYCLAFPPVPLLSFLAWPSFSIGKHLFVSLINGAWLLFFVAAAYGYGSFLLQRIVRKAIILTQLEHILFSLPIGFTVLSLVVLGGNSIAITSTWFYFTVLTAGCGVATISAYDSVNSLINRIRGITTTDILALIFVAIPCIISLVGALAPSTQFDALVYHLELPTRYLAHGGLYAVPANLFFSFPQLIEMLFQMGIALHGDTVASLTAWIFYPMTALAIYAFCSRFNPGPTGKALGYLSAIIWLYLPQAFLVSTGAFVDIALAFYLTMGIFALFLWRENSASPSLLLLSGILSGGACGIKYTGSILLAYGLLMIIFTAPRNMRIASFSIYFLSAVTVFFSWVIKNIVFLNNPLAPWGTQIFNHSLLTSAVAQSYLSHIAGHGTSFHGIVNIFMLPWNMTVHGFAFGGGFDIIGPLYLLYFPCLFLVRFRLFSDEKNSSIHRDFFAIIFFYSIVWFFTGKVLRFMLPIIPFLSIMIAGGLLAALRNGYFLKITAVTVFIAAIVHNVLMANMVLSYIQPAKVVLGGQSREQYLGQKLFYYRGVSAANALLGQNTRVLYFGETRGYY